MIKLLSAALIFLGVLPFIAVSIPPMTDLSQHVLAAHIANNLHDPVSAFDSYFSYSLTLRPNSFAHLLLSFIQRFCEPYTSAKVYLLLYTIGLWLGTWYYLHRAKVRHASAIALGALPLSFCWPVYMGFLPFAMTLPLYVVLLGWWVGAPPSWKKSLGAIILLIIIYGFHVIGTAVGGFSIFLLSVFRYFRDEEIKAKSLLVDLCAPICAGLICLFFILDSESPPLTASFYGPLGALKSLLRYTAASLGDYTLLLNTAALVLFAAAVAFCARYRESRKDVILLVFLLCAIALAMPIHLGILWPAGPRVIPFAYLTALGLLEFNTLGRNIFLFVLSLIMLANAGLNTKKSLEIEKDYSVFLSGLSSIEPGSKILPIVRDRRSSESKIDYFWSISSAYPIFRGGSHPYIFAKPYWKTGSASLEYLDHDSYGYTFKYHYSNDTERYRGVSKNYDYVVLWGYEKEIAQVLNQEMDLHFANPPLSIYKSRKVTPETDDPTKT